MMKNSFLILFIFLSVYIFAEDSKQFISFVKGAEVVDEGEGLKVLIKFNVAIENKKVIAEWVDSKGRICERKNIEVTKKCSDLSVSFALVKPIGYLHKIQFTIDGVLQLCQLSFQVKYPYKKWIDYKASVWAQYDPAFGDLLREAGINSSIGGQENVTSQDFEFYCDNIAYEVFSYYHKRSQEHVAMKELWEENPDTVVLHHRRPSLTDEGTIDKVRDRLWSVINETKNYRPIFYNIADEIGIADQSAVSDLDWEYSNRTAWVEWLQKKYVTVVALNQEWGKNFVNWSAVRAYFPSTHKIYDQLYAQNLLPKSFITIADMQKAFQTKIDSYQGLIDAFAKIRSNDAGMKAKGLEIRFKKIDKFNEHFASQCVDFEAAEKFVNTFEKWVSKQDASDTSNWNLSWWCDWRDYMDEYMAVGLGKARDIGKERDPDGIFGITGTHHPGVFSGHNYEKLMKHLDYIMPYNIGESFELMRGLNPDFLYMHPTWQKGESLRRDVWYQFLHGCRGVLIWDNFEPDNTMIDRQNFVLTKRGLAAAKDFKEINDGLDQLLLQSKRENNGIAIYHSQASARVNWMHQFVGLGRNWIKRFSWHEYKEDARNSLRTAWIKLIEDNGFQFLFLSPEQLLEGRVAKENIKIIILPEVWSLSDEEATALRKFVENGGLLLADHFAGLYDGMGKRRDKGVLDDLFGVSQNQVLGDTRYSGKEFVQREIAFNADFNNFVKKGEILKNLDTRMNGLQPVLVIDAAVAFHCGNKNDAALIERKVGQGKCVFLNIDVSGYGWLRILKDDFSQNKREKLLSIIGGYLKEKAQPFVQVLNTKLNQRQQGVEVGVWDVSDNKKVLGLWRNYQIMKDGIGGEHFVDNSIFESDEAVTVVLHEKSFVTNLRTGEDLGEIEHFDAILSPWEPLLISIRKVKEKDFAVISPASVVLGSTLNIDIKIEQKNELNVFFVELFNPDGVGYWYYKKDISGSSDVLRCEFPMALNDKPGKWKMVVKDIYNKKVVEKNFDLK